MAESGYFHAALCGSERFSRDVARITSLARRVLTDQGIAILDDGARPGDIRTAAFRLTVRAAPAPESVTARIVLRLTPEMVSRDPYLAPDLVLIIVMYRLTQALRPVAVEWLDAQAVIPAQAFLDAFDGVDSAESAQAARSRRTATPAADKPPTPELTEDQRIARRLRADSFAVPATRAEKARNDIQRLTAWAMTGCVATVSLPVAASLAAVNLIRGEDFRLNTQVLSLSGLVGTVSGFGLY
jgi:hypothetical protein